MLEVWLSETYDKDEFSPWLIVRLLLRRYITFPFRWARRYALTFKQRPDLSPYGMQVILVVRFR